MKSKNSKKDAVKVLTIKQAIQLEKKGKKLFRASNRSPLGSYYLKGYANKEHKIKFIVA